MHTSHLYLSFFLPVCFVAFPGLHVEFCTPQPENHILMPTCEKKLLPNISSAYRYSRSAVIVSRLSCCVDRIRLC